MSHARWAITLGASDGRRRGSFRGSRIRRAVALAAVVLSLPSTGAVATQPETGPTPTSAGGARPARFTARQVTGGQLRVRKGVRELSLRERQQFVAAILELKRTPSPYDERYNYYDQFVVWHQELSRCDPGDPFADHGMPGHAGPMFLPWHRQMLILFEQALHSVSGQPITLPYWDWSDRHSTAAVYREDFMGGDGAAAEGHAVLNGPFQKGNWVLAVQPVGAEWASSASPHLTRHLGGFSEVTLPTADEVDELFTRPLYDVAPFDDRSDSSRSFRNAMEGWPQRLPTGELACPPDGRLAVVPVLAGHRMHNAVHLWAGGNVTHPSRGPGIGTVAVVETSPNDPVFWLIHANVDRLWAQWQDRHGTHTYQPTSGVDHNNVDDEMRPFDVHGMHVTPRDVSDVAKLGYRYTAPSSTAGVSRRRSTTVFSVSEGQGPGPRVTCRIGQPALRTAVG